MAVDVKEQAVRAELKADTRELKREFRDDAQDMRELTQSEQQKAAEQTRMAQEAFLLWQDTNANIDAAELAAAQQQAAAQQAAAAQAAEPTVAERAIDAAKDDFKKEAVLGVIAAIGKEAKDGLPSSLNVAAAKEMNPEALKDLAEIGKGALIKDADAVKDVVMDVAAKMKM